MNLNELFDWLPGGTLEQGAIIICSMTLVLTFLLILLGKADSWKLLAFMAFALVVLSIAAYVDPQTAAWNQEPDRFAETEQETTEEIGPPENSGAQKQLFLWSSNWFEATANETYIINHEQGKSPVGAQIWYRRAGDNSSKNLMDGIFEGNGVGSFLFDVGSESVTVATGVSPTSGYGAKVSHWTVVDRGNGNGTQPRELQVVLYFTN